MHNRVKLAVKVGGEWAFVQHGEVGAVQPVDTFPKFVFHSFIKRCSRQGIADADADVVRHQVAHHFQGEFNVLAGFAGIAELQEKGDFHPMRVELSRRLVNLLDLRAFVHRVQDFLRTAFRADPYNFRARPCQRRDGFAAQQQIDPVQALEGYMYAARVQQIGKFLDPFVLNAHDVVHEPDVVGLEMFLQPRHFLDHIRGAPHIVLLSPDRFGAPVAVERAAARCDQIHRVITVMLHPYAAVFVPVNQIPGRKGQGVQRANDRTRRRFDDLTIPQIRKALDSVQAVVILQPPLYRYGEGRGG